MAAATKTHKRQTAVNTRYSNSNGQQIAWLATIVTSIEEPILKAVEDIRACNGVLHAAFDGFSASDTELKASNELLQTEVKELKTHTKKLTE